MAESEEELKNLMMVKEESKKASLIFNIKKVKIMAPGPSTSWQIEGEKVETVTDFIFLGSKQKGKKWKQSQTLFSWAPKSLQMVTAAMKLKDACSLEEKL